MTFRKIAPNKFNEILQTMSKAKIKKFYQANGMKQNNILTLPEENEEKYEEKKSMADFDFNMTFKDTRSQPKDLEKRIKDVFVNQHTQILNKRDKRVIFQDLVNAERLGIYNNLPLLTLLNDVYVRSKIDAKENKLFNVEYFNDKYDISKDLPHKYSNTFCSAIKQFQYMYPCLPTNNIDNGVINDDGQLFVNYTIGFLRFIEMRKSQTSDINQYDLVIIPQTNSIEDDEKKIDDDQSEQKSLVAMFKYYGLKYVKLALDEKDIYETYCECFEKLTKRKSDRHVVFIIDRRISDEENTEINMYGLVLKATQHTAYCDIAMYPEIHMAKSRDFLFNKTKNKTQISPNKSKKNKNNGGNNKKKTTKKKKTKKKKKKNVKKEKDKKVVIKAGNNMINGNGILSNIASGNRFALYCHIWNNDCIRLYCMINDWFYRFWAIDMKQLWPKFFVKSDDDAMHKFSSEIPSLHDKQFEQIYSMITNKTK